MNAHKNGSIYQKQIYFSYPCLNRKNSKKIYKYILYFLSLLITYMTQNTSNLK